MPTWDESCAISEIKDIPSDHIAIAFWTFFLYLHNDIPLRKFAQRGALPAGGREERTPLCRNQLEPRKPLENAATPTRRVHAVLGAL